ncbi:hypothetical protein ACTJLC_01375 [Paraburkholderia sp. 22099]|uniref:hypothetical protein n=1 Tax=Paraburkholderia sp. 22099 TaxID=3453875 RepID=UPI002858FCE7|nr:hypothetical protein [Paraburkholderia terricola]
MFGMRRSNGPSAWSMLKQSPGFESSERNMGKYFPRNYELPEPEAANAWFAYAESHGIDMSKAIGICEDAATENGT